MELDLRAVIVVGGPHRADDRQVVHAAADVREEIAHGNAALAPRAKPRLQGEDRVSLLAVGVVDDDDPHLPQFVGVLHALVGRGSDRLARVTVDLGLRVERLEVAEAAPHEEPDHIFRPRRQLGQPGPRQPGQLLGPQHAFESHRPKPEPGPQEMPPGQVGRMRDEG